MTRQRLRGPKCCLPIGANGFNGYTCMVRLLQMAKNVHDAFWRGYGSVILLRPRRRKGLQFLYKGRDIAETTATEAIAADWSMVAYHLTSACQETEDERSLAKASR